MIREAYLGRSFRSRGFTLKAGWAVGDPKRPDVRWIVFDSPWAGPPS